MCCIMPIAAFDFLRLLLNGDQFGHAHLVLSRSFHQRECLLTSVPVWTRCDAAVSRNVPVRAELCHCPFAGLQATPTKVEVSVPWHCIPSAARDPVTQAVGAGVMGLMVGGSGQL